MFWRKRKEPSNRESQPVADPPSDNDLQRQAHAAYGGRASELKSLLRSRGRDAIAEALDVDAYMASEELRPACLERLNDDPHGTVWCVLQRRHGGDHAGRCLWCDLVLMVVEEAEGRGDLSLRAWV